METTLSLAETGHYALVLAFALSVACSIIPVVGWRRGDARLMQMASPVALAQFALIGISFAALTYAYVVSDFSLKNVWENSHTDKPLIYKISGVWGNHEGSMLLWVLTLAIFAASVPLFGKHLPRDLKALVIAVQSWILLAFVGFILFTSNPFDRLQPAPPQGNDLNPLLQDLGLAIHPPLLYIGYVGFSMTFAFAVAALMIGRVDQAWARWVRPWTLAAWMFLTIGISMGSYWAYYELGWGGWWFWDPVENASLMPWLAGTALLHSAIVVEKRAGLRIWTILLAIMTFALSLLGTFLVRSGVLTSVHTFATDPGRGLVILGILVFFIAGSLALFVWRADSIQSKGLFSPISREGGLVLNNIFLSAVTGTVLIGTLYPLLYESLTGQKISVGPPFFNLTAVPLFLPLLIAMPLGPFLTWKRSDAWAVSTRMFGVLLLSAAIALGIYLWRGGSLAPLGMMIGFWLLLGSLWEPFWRSKAGRAPLGETVRRLGNLPRSMWGGALGHAGMGITTIGIVATTAWSVETIETMRPSDVVQVQHYELRYETVERVIGPNYIDDIVRFTATMADGNSFALEPAKRFYPNRNEPTTEAAIETLGFSQAYVSLGDVDVTGDGTATVRAYWRPWTTLIWYGTIVMFVGGFLSLMDRRLRIGIPQMAKRRGPQAMPEPAQ
ncbi:MAG: heme lyase CcmF/NrfE family subunit [Pseudomonadota bacterium]